MKKIFALIISLIMIVSPLSCFATVADDFAVSQALALYSASEDGSSLVIAENGIAVNNREITVTLSSENLVNNSSEISIVAYKPTGDEGTPSINNIYYLDQVVYKGGAVSFKISPNAPVGTYVLLLGASDLSAVARATFGIGVDASVVDGDVNNDSVFNTLDIIKLKRYIAKVESVTKLWTDRDSYAGDFNGDGYANILDLVIMKETIANRVVE